MATKNKEEMRRRPKSPSEIRRANKPTPTPKAVPDDFVDKRNPGRQYTQDMIDYIDPSTGEITSRTRGIVPAPGSRFVPLRGASRPGRIGGAYEEAMAQQTYNNLVQQQAAFLAAQNALAPTPTSPQEGLASSLAALRAAQNAPALTPASLQEGLAVASRAANIQNQFQGSARGVGELMPIQSQPTMGTIPSPQNQQQIPFQVNPQQNAANINQALQTYQNLFNQGAANYQAAMQQPLSPSMGGAAPAKRKPSTSSFQTPRPFG